MTARSRFVVGVAMAAVLAAAHSVAQGGGAIGPGAADGGAAAAELSRLSKAAGGTVGLAVIHVETGRTTEVNGGRSLPLYSVFKLPLAVALLKDVEQNRLRLDQEVHIDPREAVRGAVENAALWRAPVDRSVRELLELSLVRSDNTSSDALLRLAGGPAEVTRDLAALGATGIVIRQPIRAFLASPHRPHPNTASPLAMARLLSRIQKGELLQPAEREMVLGLMAQSTTGLKRIRGGLPPGTPVADKSGTGPAGTATNDVGLVTLPGARGHLAVAVFVVGSKRPLEVQEKVIADVARAVYDAYTQPRR